MRIAGLLVALLPVSPGSLRGEIRSPTGASQTPLCVRLDRSEAKSEVPQDRVRRPLRVRPGSLRSEIRSPTGPSQTPAPRSSRIALRRNPKSRRTESDAPSALAPDRSAAKSEVPLDRVRRPLRVRPGSLRGEIRTSAEPSQTPPPRWPRIAPRRNPKFRGPPGRSLATSPRTAPKRNPKSRSPPVLPPETSPRTAPKRNPKSRSPPGRSHATSPRAVPKRNPKPRGPPGRSHATSPRTGPKRNPKPRGPPGRSLATSPRTAPKRNPKSRGPPVLPPETSPRTAPKRSPKPPERPGWTWM